MHLQMIDVKLLRDNPQQYYDSARKRGFGKEEIDRFFTLDEQWRAVLKEVNDSRKERNDLSLQASKTIKKGESAEKIKEKVREINSRIAERETALKTIVSADIHYFFEGENVEAEKVNRAINLSLNKYCSVSILAIRGGADVRYSVSINGNLVESKVKPHLD